jgi:8-oxo-(d)GTP phosphatase
MSNPATVIAAGGVVWRERRGTRQVLLVHRPRYDDWSLPKGKLTTHEHVLLAAQREIEEETGQQVLIGPPLGVQRYPVRKNGGTAQKLVHYWSAASTSDDVFQPNDEVDEIAWLPVDKARNKLSYPRDVDILDALDQVVPVESTLILIRHADAVKRKEWDGKDTVIASRCTDDTGYTQPALPALIQVRGMNSQYHNNGIQAWKVAADGRITNGNRA